MDWLKSDCTLQSGVLKWLGMFCFDVPVTVHNFICFCKLVIFLKIHPMEISTKKFKILNSKMRWNTIQSRTFFRVLLLLSCRIASLHLKFDQQFIINVTYFNKVMEYSRFLDEMILKMCAPRRATFNGT